MWWIGGIGLFFMAFIGNENVGERSGTGCAFSRMGARTKPALLPTILMGSFFAHILNPPPVSVPLL